MVDKKSVSLVLGSGGARGYAHIGVIEVLLELGYEIKSISGSSMGALIGALYASGKLDEYKKWVLTLKFYDVARLLDFSFGKGGFIQGEKVFRRIEKIIGDIKIEELPISFTAVATDLKRQKEVWIQKGSLVDSVRASVAIPTIFTPKKIGNRYLVDGSVLNPVPIAPTISDNTDITIAVNLNSCVLKKDKAKVEKSSGKKEVNFYKKLEEKFSNLIIKKEKKELNKLGVFGVMIRSIDSMQKIITQYKIAGYSPDIVINIPSDACEFYEFDRAKEIIDLGREIAKKELRIPLIKNQ